MTISDVLDTVYKCKNVHLGVNGNAAGDYMVEPVETGASLHLAVVMTSEV